MKETCAQINKDLIGFSTLEVQLTEQLLEEPLTDLQEQLQTIVSDLEESNNLQPFIYKVDMKEEKYLDYKLERSSKPQFLLNIIERCAQKVFLRWHFSKQLNQ